ncbi:AI-2E family transporter [Mycoplasmatota bacterium]|nr:AI-2E family transporter [Mycoplasmatota bacterium]
MDNGKQIKRIQAYLLILVLIFIIFFIGKQLMQYPFFNEIKEAVINIIFPFSISFIIVYIFHPILYWFEKQFSIKTWVSTIVLLIVNAIILIVLIEFIFPILSQQIIDIYSELPKYIEEIELIIENIQTKYHLLNNTELFESIIAYKDKLTLNLGDYLVSFTISTVVFSFKSLWLIIMIPLLVFLMMKDYSLIYERFSLFLVRHKRSEWIQLLKNIDTKLGAYIRGQLIIMSYMFIGTFIPLAILGMPNAFIFSIIIAITNIIPYLGPYLGGVPLCIYAYFQSPQLLFASLIIIFIMQQLDGNLGQPLVFGSQLKIHPLIIMIVMIIGSTVGGIIGLLLSVPIFIILKEIYIFIKPKTKIKLIKKPIK